MITLWIGPRLQDGTSLMVLRMTWKLPIPMPRWPLHMSTEHTLTPSLVPAKHKTMMEQLQEITKKECITRIKLVETNAKEKTACKALKRKSALKIEEMHIQFQ